MIIYIDIPAVHDRRFQLFVSEYRQAQVGRSDVAPRMFLYKLPLGSARRAANTRLTRLLRLAPQIQLRLPLAEEIGAFQSSV